MPDKLTEEERERIKEKHRQMLRPHIQEQVAQLERFFLTQGRAVSRLEMLEFWRERQPRSVRAHEDYRVASSNERDRIEARLEATLEVIDELLRVALN